MKKRDYDYSRTKKTLLPLIDTYKQSHDEIVRNEILELLYSVACLEGFRIDIGKPASWREWEKKTGKAWSAYTEMPSMLNSVFKKIKKREDSLQAIELYLLASTVIEGLDSL